MKIFQRHRENLSKKLPDGLILFSSDPAKVRNNDVHYEYRQSSDFLYLTGIESDGYHVLLDPKTGSEHLFIPDPNLNYQIWEGKQLTLVEAKRRFGIKQVHYHSDFPKIFNRLKTRYKAVHHLPASQNILAKNAKGGVKKNATAIRKALNDLRVYKSAEEAALMRRANDISALAHVAVMKSVRPGCLENQMQAVFIKTCLENGARLQAYNPIFGGGRNAAILHYHDNNQTLKNGDLLLVDASAEWLGYASDITRTFPVNGRFSQAQAQIYDIVLHVQKTCIENARPGLTMVDLHRLSQKLLAKGLFDLGIFKSDDFNEILRNEAIRIFYPHGIGHLIGLDVHDVGAKPNKKLKLRNTRLLEAGMAITVEPGLYFIAGHFENKATRQKYKPWIDWKKAEQYYDVGGIRIEDDIWITQKGNENLTTVPKERSAIEKLMRNR